MTSINEALAHHQKRQEAARAEVAQSEAQRLAEIGAREKVAATDAFKVVATRAEELAQKAMRVTTTSADLSEILKAQGEIKALSGLIQLYTSAEAELRTARQQGG